MILAGHKHHHCQHLWGLAMSQLKITLQTLKLGSTSNMH